MCTTMFMGAKEENNSIEEENIINVQYIPL